MKKIIYCLIITTLMSSCKNAPVFNDPIPNHNHFAIQSEILNETREINVWTPPDYNETENALPVLYMPDGGTTNEDFPHIANTLAELVKSKSIPPLILVGIKNIDRRKDLSGFSEIEKDSMYCPLTDGAKDFRAFISKELIPHINKNYRTSNEKGILGESLAGLFVMETFLTAPETFDYYIAMDPSLWWNDHYLVRNSNSYFKKFPDNSIKLWFAGSSVEDISIHTNNLNKALETNAPTQLIWIYSDEPNEKHNTIFRATKEKALIWSFN